MLTGLRDVFSKGFMRYVLFALMGLLVASFAIWGIGDIFRGGTTTTLAQVGGTQVSVQAFQSAYNREVQNLGRMIGRGITPDQARQLGIDRRVLGQLVTDATLDERGRQLGLGIDNDTIRERIVTSPAFRGPTGQFDRNAFAEVLRQFGFNEQSYIDYERRLAVRQQIAGAVSDKIAPPQILVDALARFQNETRTADFLVLGARAAGDVPVPEPGVLEAYFEARKASFRAPEYRKLALLVVAPEEQVGFMQPPPERVEEEFQRLRDTTERRTIEQIVFPTPEEAAAASARLKAGLAFEELARERGIAAADLSLGALSRSQIADPAVRTAAFALAEGATSEPVRGAFGAVLLRVTKVEAASEGALREQARQAVAQFMARETINSYYDRIERERATGLPLAEIAAKVGLAVTVVEAVDAQGRDPGGAQLNLMGGNELLTAAFRAETGLENEPVTVRQTGAFVWYEVAAVTPARDRTLEEARAEVEARWREDEVKARIGRAATEMTEQVRQGKPLAELAAAAGLSVRTTAPLTRAKTEGEWGPAAVQVLFATPQGRAGNAPAADGIDQIVFVTREIALPANAGLDERTRNELAVSIENDVLDQYVQRLRLDYGASINQTALSRAIGGSDGR